MLLLRSSLTMDCRNIYFVVFGLSLLTLQCALSGPGRTVWRVHGYPSTLPVPYTGYPFTLPVPHTGYPSTLTVPHTRYPSTLPVSHTGYPSTLPVPHTGYPSTLPVSHTGYPSTLPVPHTGYPSTLPVPHTGYPSTLPVPHTGYPSNLIVPHTEYPSTLPVPHADSTRLCHTSEKLLSQHCSASFCWCQYRPVCVPWFLFLVMDTVPVFLPVSAAVGTRHPLPSAAVLATQTEEEATVQRRTGKAGKEEDSSSQYHHRPPTTIELQVWVELFQSCSCLWHFCFRPLLPDAKGQAPYCVALRPVYRLLFRTEVYGNSRVGHRQRH